ncbi:hypothetical protein THRCLA_21593 [Thraustotheca clavata]|uniref:DDE Tnp4 domain-containing protein n=1 Tax=Thraustotheca clavata TaxID=74557 RepID=A0A1V9ZVL2_9STRA|nr:hypothetical protein THRCLA_21593 [Thraustotheca clavata]
MYNKAHVQTRNPIDRAFGSLKGRFAKLKCELDSESCSMDGKLIASCVVLHNFSLRFESLTNTTFVDVEQNPEDYVDLMLEHATDQLPQSTMDSDTPALELGRRNEMNSVDTFNG